MRTKCCDDKLLHNELYDIWYCKNCLELKPEPKLPKWLLLLSFLFLFALSICGAFSQAGNGSSLKANHHQKEKLIFDPSDTNQLLDTLIAYDCPLPNIAIAQARLETGNFTSRIYLENNNIFGIKVNTHGYCTGERLGHATYLSVLDCIKDYVRIQKTYLKIADKHYAKDTKYITKLYNLDTQ